MPTDSGFQDSVEKSREALRRTIADEPAGQAQHWPSEPRSNTPPVGRPSTRDLHPFFHGLLETLPEPGSDWPTPNREQWLETARNIFALLYHEPPEMREPIPIRPQQPASIYGSDQRVA